MKFIHVMIAASITILAACSSGDEDAGKRSANNKEKPQGVIPQHQLQALEKAKAVEQQLQEADAARREAIEKTGDE